MADNQAEKFFEHVDGDKDSQAELKKSAHSIRELAAKKGYHFTVQEMYAALRKRSGLKHPAQYADPDTCCFL